MVGTLKERLTSENVDEMQRPSKPKGLRSLDSSQMFALIGLIISAGGGAYYFTNSSSGTNTLIGQEDSVFEDDQIFVTNRVVIGPEANEDPIETENIVITGDPTVITEGLSEDEAEKLRKKITLLEKENVQLEAKLDGEVKLVKELRKQLNDRDKEYREMQKQFERQLSTEIKKLNEAHDLELKSLENRLKMLSGLEVNMNAEQERLMKEEEARRRAQIESEGIIFDDTKNNERIRY